MKVFYSDTKFCFIFIIFDYLPNLTTKNKIVTLDF